MYKYSYKGQVRTARDFSEARFQAGLPHTDPILSASHYAVRLWQWDDAERNYSVEILSTPGHQTFTTYDEALICYNTLAEFFTEEIDEDIKMELVHFHLDETFHLGATFLYPPADTWQWPTA